MESMPAKLEVRELANSGDARGLSFTAPADGLALAGRRSDVPVAATKPGAIGGDHYHLRRREGIVALPGTKVV